MKQEKELILWPKPLKNVYPASSNTITSHNTPRHFPCCSSAAWQEGYMQMFVVSYLCAN